MIVKIEWFEDGRRGYMEYDGDVMIKHMPMTNYKKWATLFAMYGTSQQHNDFLSAIKRLYRESYEHLNECLAANDTKKAKRIKDTMHKLDRKYELLLRLI